MRTGLALSAAAGLLLMGAVPAQAAGWTHEKFPEPGKESSDLSTVVSDGETTWALGTEQGSTPHETESRAFQRGSDGWQEMPSPGVGEATAGTMAAPGDMWAAGQHPKDSIGQVAHWDGNEWSEVPTAEPPEGSFHTFNDMTSFASDDVWLAGVAKDRTGQDGGSDGVVQRWDGNAWTSVELPELDTPKWNVSTIGGTATDDLWALGESNAKEDTAKGIALHWNGKEWTGVPMPTFDGASGVTFTDVAAQGPDDMHAVGTVEVDGSSKAVAVHWNGKEWTKSDLPDTPGSLSDVTVAGDQLWAFGSSEQGYALRYEGGAWKESEAPESQKIASGTELADGSLLVVGSVATDQAQQATGWRYEG